MPIQNTFTKEIMDVETYKQRCFLEDLFKLARGTLRSWKSQEIEYHYRDIKARLED